MHTRTHTHTRCTEDLSNCIVDSTSRSRQGTMLSWHKRSSGCNSKRCANFSSASAFIQRSSITQRAGSLRVVNDQKGNHKAVVYIMSFSDLQSTFTLCHYAYLRSLVLFFLRCPCTSQCLLWWQIGRESAVDLLEQKLPRPRCFRPRHYQLLQYPVLIIASRKGITHNKHRSPQLPQTNVCQAPRSG